MSDDLISRQAAIDAIEKVDDYGDGIAFEVLSHAQMDISLLPSAERRGRWVGIDDEPCEVWECDQCGNIVEREIPPKYCEKCGARMDGEEE